MKTIFDQSNLNFQNSSVFQVASPVSIPRKSPRKQVYQKELDQNFIADDVIKNFSGSLYLSGYSFQQKDDQVVFLQVKKRATC